MCQHVDNSVIITYFLSLIVGEQFQSTSLILLPKHVRNSSMGVALGPETTLTVCSTAMLSAVSDIIQDMCLSI